MVYSFSGGKYGFYAHHGNNLSHVILVADVNQYLGEPEALYQTSYNLAWPQVLAFSGAVVGVLITGMIVKSLSG